MNLRNKNGITIIEILIVVSIMAVIGASTAPLYSNFLVRTYFKDKTNELVSCLRTAQLNTISGKENSQWGVHISPSKIIMFKGSAYVDPGTAFDYQYDIPKSITISQKELVFNQLTGNASDATTITITSNAGESKTISINEVGTVDVQ